MISQYTFASRTARAISCVYWLPKSRTRIFSVIITVRNSAVKQVPVAAKIMKQLADAVATNAAGYGEVFFVPGKWFIASLLRRTACTCKPLFIFFYKPRISNNLMYYPKKSQKKIKIKI